jgi:hypothetical protein
MIYTKGTVNVGDKHLPDHYGNIIHVGAKVAYNKSGEVRSGIVMDVDIKEVIRRSYDPDEEVKALIRIKESQDESISKVKNIGSIIVI